MQPPPHELLDTPIQQLKTASEAFKLRSKQLGFATIREITASDKAALHQHPHFDYGWYTELLRLLKKYELVGMMNR
ncbi:hypothetical protein SAMN05216436_12032 [bacterium A37T11]|nr:hypothetical protein SAMN05216436_12032 [bacterium A37T11]